MNKLTKYMAPAAIATALTIGNYDNVNAQETGLDSLIQEYELALNKTEEIYQKFEEREDQEYNQKMIYEVTENNLDRLNKLNSNLEEQLKDEKKETPLAAKVIAGVGIAIYGLMTGVGLVKNKKEYY